MSRGRKVNETLSMEPLQSRRTACSERCSMNVPFRLYQALIAILPGDHIRVAVPCSSDRERYMRGSPITVLYFIAILITTMVIRRRSNMSSSCSLPILQGVNDIHEPHSRTRRPMDDRLRLLSGVI